MSMALAGVNLYYTSIQISSMPDKHDLNKIKDKLDKVEAKVERKIDIVERKIDQLIMFNLRGKPDKLEEVNEAAKAGK